MILKIKKKLEKMLKKKKTNYKKSYMKAIIYGQKFKKQFVQKKKKIKMMKIFPNKMKIKIFKKIMNQTKKHKIHITQAYQEKTLIKILIFKQ